MNSLRIAWTELRRITAGRLPRLAVLAMILIPSLYAGLYLYANHDPYARLDQVPAALVIADAGATGTDGQPLDAGRRVADNLIDSDSFDWTEVDEQAARDGVEEGRFDFALVIPRDFSRSLTSVGTADPRQARIRLVTNDANSYLSTTIANTVVDKVRDAVASEVSVEASQTFLMGLADVRAGLLDGADGAAKLRDGLADAHAGSKRLKDGADRLATGAGDLKEGAGELRSGLSTMAEQVEGLPASTKKLAQGARKVAQADQRIAEVGDSVANAADRVTQRYGEGRDDLTALMDEQGLTAEQQQSLLAVYDRLGEPIKAADREASKVSGQLDELATGAGQVADGADALATATPRLVAGVDAAAAGSRRLAAGAGELETGAGTLADGADELHAGLGKLKRGAADLRRGLADGAEQVPAMDAEQRAAIADTIGNPVDVRSQAQTDAGSYGAGLAPFFMALATWIGGYVLFLVVRPLSNRALAANQTPLRIALGGWLTPALIGVAQVSVMLAIVGLALGIEPANVVGTWLFLILITACFVAIIHALNALWGTPGQFLGLVLMVLQLVTAGGTFPWQTIPQPLYVVHHLLPMSYAVDGLRQLLYGGLEARVLTDALVLGAWLVAALLVTARVARKQRVWTPKRVKPELVL
ncbi:YhgE/Pip domain-containing protein [Nocardioides dubius]|uniref:YhgE/Pip domain-containing protein n=1 Tax=Nocardioides dubius TaxID=317019 RepID=A0ABP4EKF1_9ACTN